MGERAPKKNSEQREGRVLIIRGGTYSPRKWVVPTCWVLVSGRGTEQQQQQQNNETHIYLRIHDNRIHTHGLGTDTDTDTGTGTGTDTGTGTGTGTSTSTGKSGGDGTNTGVINWRLRIKNNHTASIMGCAVLCCAVLRNKQSQFHRYIILL